MAKLIPSLTFAAALSTISLAASADPTPNTSSFLAFPNQCTPGSRAACMCDNGASGVASCSPSGFFSACVCANVVVEVPVPVVPVIVVPDIRFEPVRVRRRRPSPPMPGLALLIGGACTLGTGAFNVGFGVERIKAYGADPFGIVSVSLGGTAMLIGLPLTIIGIVRYATEPKEKEDDKAKDSKSTGIRFAPTADGFAIHF